MLQADLLGYLESVMHVYNRLGRRDNKYKARIKILVQEQGLDETRAQIDDHFQANRHRHRSVSQELLDRIELDFAPPDLRRPAIMI